ncbi:MAG: hypothetical protein ABI606_11895 [Rhodoferax sp.]
MSEPEPITVETLDSIPAVIPYLQALAGRIEQWRARLPTLGIRIGLVWKGNPRFENDADRSLPDLEVLAPLWQVADVQFISLQKGAGEDQAMRLFRQSAAGNWTGAVAELGVALEALVPEIGLGPTP